MIRAVVLLVLSNVFMTFAWYVHRARHQVTSGSALLESAP